MQHSNVFYVRKGGKDNPIYEPIRTATIECAIDGRKDSIYERNSKSIRISFSEL